MLNFIPCYDGRLFLRGPNIDVLNAILIYNAVGGRIGITKCHREGYYSCYGRHDRCPRGYHCYSSSELSRARRNQNNKNKKLLNLRIIPRK